MKKFVVNIIAFTLILLSLYLILFHYVNKLYLESYGNGIDLNFNSYLLSDSQGAALGNTTEEFNIFNFSADSDSYADMIRKINYLIENSSVQTIFITVCDHTLSFYRQRKNNLDRSAVFTLRSDYSSYYEYLKEKFLRRYIVLFNPKSGVIMRNYIFSKIDRIFNPNNSSASEVLWESLTSEEKKEKSKRRAMFQFPDEKLSIELSDTLYEIMNICMHHKINLIGVKYPLSPDYLKAIENRSYHADRVFIERGLKVLDFSKNFPPDDTLFKDPDHLNKKGAVVFTQMLGDSVKSLNNNDNNNN